MDPHVSSSSVYEIKRIEEELLGYVAKLEEETKHFVSELSKKTSHLVHSPEVADVTSTLDVSHVPVTEIDEEHRHPSEESRRQSHSSFKSKNSSNDSHDYKATEKEKDVSEINHDKRVKPKKSAFEKISSCFRNITIEPLYLLFSFGLGVFFLISPELMIQKVCRVNLGYNETICDNVQQHRDIQVKVQQKVATLNIYHNILSAIPSSVFLLFAGAWSDIYGRKPLMLMAFLGQIFTFGVLMINTIFFEELRAEFMFFDVIQNVLGGNAAFFMCVYAYIVDITDPKESRTMRMGLLPGLWGVGSNLGKALGGIFKKKFGFMFAFATALIALGCGCIYTCCISESIDVRAKKIQRKLEKGQQLSEEDKMVVKHMEIRKNDVDLKTKILNFMDFSNVKKGFGGLTKKRDNNERLYLILMIFALEMEMFINVGEWSNAYLYFRRKLQWDIGDFTRYTTIIGIIGILSQYIAIPVLTSKKVNLRDSTISLMDMVGCIIQTLIIAFTPVEWPVYLAACISFLDYSSYSMLRCMISKIVGPIEVGSVLAMAGAIQAFVPLVSSPFFGLIYRNTVEFFPQTHLLVITGCFCINFCCLFAVDRHLRKKKKQSKIAKEEEAENFLEERNEKEKAEVANENKTI